jgi:effector-binding domain-containing protein
MAANGLEAAGPVRIVTNEFGSQTYSFDVVQPVRKAGATGKLDIKLEGPVTANYTEPTKIAVTRFKGHMANLNRIRDALRGWVMTRGYETTERPYENWIGGLDKGFTEEGEFEVVWAVK